MTQREPEPLPLDADDDQAEAGPGVEPVVEQQQCGRIWRELEEADGGRGGWRAGDRSRQQKSVDTKPASLDPHVAVVLRGMATPARAGLAEIPAAA